MSKIDSDLLAKLMALPEHDREKVLEFLGAQPASEDEIASILAAFSASLSVHQSKLDQRRPS